MRFNSILRCTLAASALLGSASSLFAATNVQDPSGKTVLVVDGDTVKADAAGKPLFTIDGDNIKDADGKLVLYINGDNIRTEPNGPILLIIDGRHIKREVGGTNLLYVDGKDLMRGDRSGKPLYRFAGDDLDRQRRMAVLYALMPELFKQGKDADAATVAAQAKAGAASDADAIQNFAPGNYTIDIYQSNDASSYKGTVAIVKVGDVLAMDFKFTRGDPLQGVAVQHGDEVWAAVGPAGTVGLAVYKVADGKLAGTWYNVTGKPESFGSENATGTVPLANGDYKITDTKAPFTLAAYTGTLSLEAADRKIDGTIPIFHAAWDLGGFKAKGIGFAEPDSLAVASSTAPDFQIIRFKINLKDNELNGQFYSAANVRGLWSLRKAK